MTQSPNRIREKRQTLGWSLQQLADASGTSKSQIDKLEKGLRRLTVDWMVRLAKPLGCDPRDLIPVGEARTDHPPLVGEMLRTNPALSDINNLAAKVIARYAAEKRKIVTAESCTGGLIASALTDIPGASAVFERGFVAYSNDAKIDVLGVLPETLDNFGAVSAEVADAMAEGALAYSLADVAVSVTGIAGPTGATQNKPIGLVYFGIATKDGARFHYRCDFKGDRNSIRQQATQEALKLLLSVE